MIKQIALPSIKEVEYNKQNADALDSAMNHRQIKSSMSDAHDQQRPYIEKAIGVIENELNTLIAQGYTIIGQYSFNGGFGVNLILYKPD